MTGHPSAVVADVFAALETAIVADPSTMMRVEKALGAAVRLLIGEPWFDHTVEPLFAHVTAACWQWEAAFRTPAVTADDMVALIASTWQHATALACVVESWSVRSTGDAARAVVVEAERIAADAASGDG